KDGWGSFPKSWVDFNVKTGQQQYWYTSGGAADPRKPTTPISVKYTAADAQPDPTETPKPERTTSHEVTGASAAAGLTVAVTGEGYTNLPKASTGSDPAGVYAAIVDRSIASDDVDRTTPVAATPVFELPDGKLSASVTAETAKLKKESDYDLLVWVAHGLPKGEALLYRKPIELTAAQKEALFPGTTDPTEDPKPTGDPTDGPKPTDDPTTGPKPTGDPTDDPTEDPKPTDNPTTDPKPTDDPSESGTPTEDPSEDPQPAEPSLTVEPKTVSLSDFLKEDKGAVVTASGLTPGNEYEVAISGGTNVKGVTLKAKADKDGVAVYRVYGQAQDRAKNYIGTYTVKMAEPDLTASFTVTADDDAGGGGNDNGDNSAGRDSGGKGSGGKGSGGSHGKSHGSSLPRTGAEVTAAGIGAALLVVGGAALIATRRSRR
ncbi:LPXTG cell wall anchor domain-containing protein, partial [Brevibacterium otitidis]